MSIRRPALALLWMGLVATPAAAQQLYWLDTNYSAPALHRANADGTQAVSIPLTPGSLPEGLALDASRGRLYWTEAHFTGARLMSAPLTLSAPTPVLSGLDCLRGITVAAGTALYWTSSDLAAGSLVRSSDLAGAALDTLMSLGSISNPRGIGLDPSQGKMAFADFDQNRIVIANLDGSAPVVVPTGAGSAPYGVAVDASLHRVYWTEFGTGLLRRCRIDGTSVTPIFSGLANPTYLAVDPVGQLLYWVEAGAGAQRIRSGHTVGGTITALGLPVSTYGGIAFAASGTTAAPATGPIDGVALASPEPNPARGAASVEYALPRDARVCLTVRDVQGRTIEILADGVERAGRHHLEWPATGARAVPPAGLYFVELRAEGRRWVRRLVLEH